MGLTRKEVKYQLFSSIDKLLNPYKAGQNILLNRNQCGEEKEIIDQQISFYKKKLQEVFTNGEIFLMKNQLYQKADLRCEFREMGRFLPREEIEKLYELERTTSSDRGRGFIKVCQRLGLVELRKPLEVYENIAKNESTQNNMKKQQGQSSVNLSKENRENSSAFTR